MDRVALISGGFDSFCFGHISYINDGILSWHQLINTFSKTRDIIEIQYGDESEEDDIEREDSCLSQLKP